MMGPIETVTTIYDAMAERNFDRLFATLDPLIVVSQDEALPWGGRHSGHDGFAAFGLALTETIESAVTTEVMFMADGDVIQVGRTRGTVRANGVAFDLPEVHRWTIVDGLAVRARFAIDTPGMLRALHGEPSTDADGTARYS